MVVGHHQAVGETNQPEPPLLKRTRRAGRGRATCRWARSRTSSSCSRGGLLNSHMPSSAWMMVGIMNRPNTAATAARMRNTVTHARLSVGVLPAAASHPPMSLRYSPWRGESLPIDATNIRVPLFPRCPTRLRRLHSFSVPTGFAHTGFMPPDSS